MVMDGALAQAWAVSLALSLALAVASTLAHMIFNSFMNIFDDDDDDDDGQLQQNKHVVLLFYLGHTCLHDRSSITSSECTCRTARPCSPSNRARMMLSM